MWLPQAPDGPQSRRAIHRLSLEAAVTACITTFRRPASLARLVRSLERFYPRLTVRVQHTGGNLSWGRNRLVESCDTDYFLLLEEDFEFTADTDLHALYDILLDDELAGAGGTLFRKDGRKQFWCHDFSIFREQVQMWPASKPWRISPQGHPYRPCDALLNFGIFRTDVLRQTGWDEHLPLSEHQDFFFRLWQSRQWRMAYTPSCSALHHHDRPASYREMRQRNFTDRSNAKHGRKFAKFTHAERELPNIVILGVGHANTSITTRQLGAFGWNLGDADEEYAESVSVRDANRSGRFCRRTMAAALKSIPQPWAIKEPQFVNTLDRWRAVLAPYEPVLLWITKDPARVTQSYVRRGKQPDEAARLVADRTARAARQFELWPWAKLTIDARQVRAAVELFDLAR